MSKTIITARTPRSKFNHSKPFICSTLGVLIATKHATGNHDETTRVHVEKPGFFKKPGFLAPAPRPLTSIHLILRRVDD